MFNKVIIAGNLTRDIELRYLPSGTAAGSSAIASNRRFKSSSGEQKEEVLFIDITFFGRTAEIANQYLKKGSKVLLEGRLKLDSWSDQYGNKRSRHSIIVENMQMLDSKNEDQSIKNISNHQQQETYNKPEPQKQQTKPQNEQIPEIDIDDDEIPF